MDNMKHCKCENTNSGMCEFCQDFYNGIIDESGELTEYGKSLIVEEREFAKKLDKEIKGT